MACNVPKFPSVVVHVHIQISLFTTTCVGAMSNFACKLLVAPWKHVQVQCSCFHVDEHHIDGHVCSYNVKLGRCCKLYDYCSRCRWGKWIYGPPDTGIPLNLRTKHIIQSFFVVEPSILAPLDKTCKLCMAFTPFRQLPTLTNTTYGCQPQPLVPFAF